MWLLRRVILGDQLVQSLEMERRGQGRAGDEQRGQLRSAGFKVPVGHPGVRQSGAAPLSLLL